MALPMAGIALLVKLDSPGPVFFRQTRWDRMVGRSASSSSARWSITPRSCYPSSWTWKRCPQPAFKLRSDPRVTRVGRLLRRWSLDEVPQLFNVLAGEMSLVGPRPEQIEVVTRYTDDQRRRLAVKPGMTGPMQVSGRGDLSFEERLGLELAYIQKYSLRRDLSILLRTMPAVLRGDGAY